MKQVELLRLTLENFKSFRRPTTLELTDQAGLVFVNGDNCLEPRLGANGSGKSTLWDALCFALYGTSVRGVRTGELVASGARSTAVTLALRVDGKDVALVRSGPPLRVFIDGKQAEQADVDRLVGLTRERWLNSVVFGQAEPLFIDLPVPQRGELLDEVLDLQLWMRAADRAGKEMATRQKKLNDLRVEIGRTEGAISALEDLDELIDQEKRWEAQKQELLESLIVAFEEKETLLESLPDRGAPKPKAEELAKKLEEARESESEAAREVAIADHSLSAFEAEAVEFEKAGDFCPVCSQKIDPKFAKKHLATLHSQTEALVAQVRESSAALRAVRDTRVELQGLWQKANAADREAAREHAIVTEQRLTLQRDMNSLEKRIDAESASQNPYEERIHRTEEESVKLQTKLVAQEEDRKNLAGEIASLDFWKQGFRRVRLYCLRRVLGELEVETMNAASSLGLIGWKISYSTETETKSGSMRMGVQAEVTSPTLTGQFSTWSGGEGQRIRLCSALGLAGLIQRWAGVHWNLEVFDEPTSWLSEAGIEDLLALLQDRAESAGRPIYLSDHRALNFAGFSKVLTVVKDEEGSYVQ